MRRYWTIAMLLLLSGPATARAQGPMQIQRIDDPPRIAAYAELGGSAWLSANVDVLVAPLTYVRFGGFATPAELTDLPWNALVMVNHLFGSGGHYLETSVGLVAIHGFDHGIGQGRTINMGPTAAVGYRIQTKRHFARIVLTPAPPLSGGRRRGPMIGFSLGQTF
jgi:hypothetical protein